MTTPLTSTRNPRVLEVVALHRSRARREQCRHLVEGPHAVQEALRSGVVDEVFVTGSLRHDLDVPGEVRLTEVSEHVMERLCDARTPQGVVAVARTTVVEPQQLVGRGLLVVLFEVADPGNLGTIVRTADAAGAAGVVVTSGSADAFSPKCVRAAAGSTYHLPIAVGASFDEVVDACRAAGQSVVALEGGASTTVFDLAPGEAGLALVLGNEAHGLPPRVIDRADVSACVPLQGRAESLNVAAAAAIAIYAAARGLHRSS